MPVRKIPKPSEEARAQPAAARRSPATSLRAGRAASATPASASAIAASLTAPMPSPCATPTATGTTAPSALSGATIDIGPSSAAR